MQILQLYHILEEWTLTRNDVIVQREILKQVQAIEDAHTECFVHGTAKLHLTWIE